MARFAPAEEGAATQAVAAAPAEKGVAAVVAAAPAAATAVSVAVRAAEEVAQRRRRVAAPPEGDLTPATEAEGNTPPAAKTVCGVAAIEKVKQVLATGAESGDGRSRAEAAVSAAAEVSTASE